MINNKKNHTNCQQKHIAQICIKTVADGRPIFCIKEDYCNNTMNVWQLIGSVNQSYELRNHYIRGGSESLYLQDIQ